MPTKALGCVFRHSLSAFCYPKFEMTSELQHRWQHEEGLIAFQNEIIKSFYYRCRC